MTTSKTAQPTVEKEDFRISYRQDRFLAWPFLGRAYCFDGTELVVNFYSSPCRYERLLDIRHTQVLENSTVITARSLDGGQTWPDDQQTELFDLRSTYSELEAGRRLDVDMRQPDSILFSYAAYNWEGKRDFVPPKVAQAPTLFHRCIVIRSPDRGRTWETRPTWIDRLNISEMRTFSNFLRRSDGVILLPASTGGAIEEHECVLFSSHDGGESWAFYSRIVGPTGPGGLRCSSTVSNRTSERESSGHDPPSGRFGGMDTTGRVRRRREDLECTTAHQRLRCPSVLGAATRRARGRRIWVPASGLGDSRKSQRGWGQELERGVRSPGQGGQSGPGLSQRVLDG